MENRLKIENKIECIYGNFSLVFYERNDNDDYIIFCKRIFDKIEKYSLFLYQYKTDKINIISIDLELKKAIKEFNNLINKE